MFGRLCRHCGRLVVSPGGLQEYHDRCPRRPAELGGQALRALHAVLELGGVQLDRNDRPCWVPRAKR